MRLMVIGVILFSISCTSPKQGYTWALQDLKDCADDQIFLYGDLCAEARDISTDPIEQHYNGVKCGVEGIKWCMGLK